jgi:hypothetical protein
MATRTSNGNKRLGKVQGWGIATGAGKNIELVATANGRLAIRALKRASYAGSEFKVVKIDAVLTHYTK